MQARTPLIAGNWKMYGRRADLAQIAAVRERIGQASAGVEVLFCPPAPFLAEAAIAAGDSLAVGAQDCSAIAEDAPRTGEISAGMLGDCGARYVIVGHSERRTQHGESSFLVRKKAEAAQAAGLVPIVCLGETAAERAAGEAVAVVRRQLTESVPPHSPALVVAYEPVWAIGGDRTPTVAEIGEIHGQLRAGLHELHGAARDAVRILYGGSVNARNAGEIFAIPDVDGALVGRASLKAEDFAAIILAHPAALRSGN